MEWYNETIASALDKTVRRNPDAEALVQRDQRVTYQELADRVRQIATGMGRIGITRGKHIGVLHPNDIIVQILHYSSACLGTVYVPVNTMFSPRDLRYILGHADISMLFVGGKYRDRPIAEILIEALPELRQMDGPNLVLPEHPKLRWIVQVDPGKPLSAAFVTMDELEKAGAEKPLPFVNKEIKPEDISHLVYTSGSTAFPKGALLTHRGMVNGAFWWGEALTLSSSDRYLALLPFSHTGGLIVSSMDTLLRGGCLNIVESIDPIEVMEIVQREKITGMGAFDAILHRILEHPERSKYDLSSWQKTSSFSGAPYDRRIEAGISHAVCFYALTEASNPVSIVMPDEKRHNIRRNSNGRPLPGVEVRIVSLETEEELPPGIQGEVRFRGWNRLVGYYKPGPDETPEKVFDRDGFFRTGDYGYLDDEGYLYITGRYKDIIKTGGENVSPLEVENFLCDEVPGVVMAQVVGVPDELWEQAVTAFIEVKPGINYTAHDIIKICKEKLTAFKVPKHVFFIGPEDWPMTSTSKIRKNELRNLAIHALASQGKKS
jgi:fatty-acyl-CoA synthase